MQFEELQAAVAMGLTISEYNDLPGVPAWVDPTNPTLSKSDVVAWYRLSRLIPIIMDDAASKKVRR